MLIHQTDLSKVKKLKTRGDKKIGQCPVCHESGHDKKGEHLAIFNNGDGKFCCIAHPDDKAHQSAIWSYIGVTTPDNASDVTKTTAPKPKQQARIVATYDYTDADGKLLHQTVRKEPKTFLQRRPAENGKYIWSLKDYQTVLYNLPGIASIDDGKPVVIVEGEKDADSLNALGYVATTAPMGAGKWQDSYTDALRGLNVIIVPDNDTQGLQHAVDVSERLEGVASSVRVASLKSYWDKCPEKGDISDYIQASEEPKHDVDALLISAKSADETQEESKQIDKQKFADMMQGLVASTPENLQSMEELCGDAVFILPGIAMMGQFTVLNAQWNTGKTLFTLWLLTQRDKQATKDATIYYVNADDDYPNAVIKARIMEEHGVHSIIPGQGKSVGDGEGRGFDPKQIETIMQSAIDFDSAGGIVLILDTLKKFADLMEKRTLRKFLILCRNFTMAGGTLIALAHTNKHKTAGVSIAEGAGDTWNDCDCAYILDEVEESPDDKKTVVFKNGKLRGPNTLEALFTFNRSEGLTWLERFASVEQISKGQSQEVISDYEAEKRHNTDMEIINYLRKRILGSATPVSETRLTHEDLVGQPGSKASRARVLYDYAQTNTNFEFQHWRMKAGETGGKVFMPMQNDELL
jgi:5S rRNA maturation endonuclease (ribonuclease M5)